MNIVISRSQDTVIKDIIKLDQNLTRSGEEVSVEHLIALLTQCFQTPLTPRMYPVWDFVVGIFARKALNMGRVLSPPS